MDAILEQPSTRLPGDKRLEKRKLREKSEKITISKELHEKISILTKTIKNSSIYNLIFCLFDF